MKSENIRAEQQMETGRSSRAQTSQQVASTAAAPSTLQTEDNDEDQQQSSQVRRDDNQEQEEREGQAENSQEDDGHSGSNVPEENQLELTVEKAIQRIFEIQRHYQGLTTDLQHKLSVLNLKTESQESLALDLEIL